MVYIYIYIYILLRCHVPCGLAECQVHQLMRRWLWFVERYLMSQISPTPKVEPHFKAISRVLGELLKVRTANWLASPLQIQGLQQVQLFYNKIRTLNCRVWVNRINNNILLLHKRKKQKSKTVQVKVRSEKVFLYPGGASTRISVSRTKPLIRYLLMAEDEKVVR